MSQKFKNRRFITLFSIILFLIIGGFCFYNYHTKAINVYAAADCVSGGGLTCTQTTSGAYTINKYTYSSASGPTSWVVPAGIISVEYLVVGGGGGGGRGGEGGYVNGGGGGAGGFLTGTLSVTSGASISVTVGGGGAAGPSQSARGGSGGNSSFGSTTSIGGGGGGGGYATANGLSGGSGGGGGVSSNGSGGSGTSGQGYAGGNVVNGCAQNSPTGCGGGGGGGAGGAGGGGGPYPGAAGIGRSSSIIGTTVTYAAGGSGARGTTAGPANTGNGGQAGDKDEIGAAGGSGIVIIRYAIPVNGSCGSSNGGNFTSAPSSNLCSAGTATSVTGSGPWNWTCTGLYGGTTASCSANSSAYVSAVSSSTNLSCFVTNGACSGTTIFNLYDYLGNHAELPAQTNYAYKVCCTGTNISNSCSGNYSIVLKLSGTTNAHAEKNTLSNYTNNVCLSSSTLAVSCTYGTSCSSDFTCLASISGDTDAHIGQCSAYATKVCCRVGVPVDACTSRVASNKFISSKATDIQLCSGADITNTSDPCYNVCWKGTGTPVVTSSSWKCGICHDASNNPVSCSTLSSTTFSWVMPTGYVSPTNYTLVSGTLTSANPIIKFVTQDSNRQLTLGINTYGVSCSSQSGKQANPTWKEISPFK